ncbi:MAG TPA: hypothetical protein VM389_08620 [Phycisphaerae bacterium]|nr:hypothetical protein [Phycisphaerae bacterium]HUU22585.1 hypothetical protein [Phycisphaerae bacterium]
MKVANRVAMTAGMISLAWLAGGCAPGPFNVKVFVDETDQELKDKMGALQSIEVDLVAVNETQYQQWEQMKVSDYWEPTNRVRASAPKIVMKFGQGQPKEQVLSAKDDIWRKWLDENKANYLFVIAHLWWITEDSPGNADPRREILPLERGRWEGSALGNLDIPIKIRAAGLVTLRQPKKD